MLQVHDAANANPDNIPASEAVVAMGAVARRKPLTIDPTTLTIDSGVPVAAAPKPKPSQRHVPWLPLIQKMQLGDSVFIPDATVIKTAFIRKGAKAIGVALVARAVEGGVRLFRIEAKPAKTAAAAAAPTPDDGL